MLSNTSPEPNAHSYYGIFPSYRIIAAKNGVSYYYYR